MKPVKLFAPVLLLAAVACGGDDDTATPEAERSRITIKTSEYAFSLPSTFKGGLVEITVDNSTGKEAHEAGMIRLDEGKTLADYVTASQQGPPPSWAHSEGGPGPVPAGKSAVYTANVPAGTYAFLCFVPAPDGQDHAAKGMTAQAQVSAGTSGTLPAADVTISGNEFAFEGTDELKAGSQTVRFANTGEQDHHAAVFALAPGKKAADLAAFFGATQPSGPPPFTGLVGLISTLAPGGEAVRTMDLESGVSYVFICFIPDTDGTPHSAKGMTVEVTV